MPTDLLCDVIEHDDPASGARRRLSLLPISIAAHVAVALAIVIVPLTAEVEMPSPAPVPRPVLHAIAVAPSPTAPPGTNRSSTRTKRLDSPPRAFGVPLTAPRGIAAEPRGEVIEGAIPGPTVESGLGLNVGVPTPLPDRVDPPPPVRHAPVRLGGTIRPPAKIVDVAPVYPLAAQAARLEGVVVLEATIDERGSVEQLRVVKSAPMFDRAALEAVRRWRFTPTLLNGVPVPVLMTVTVNFTLNR